MTLHRALLSVSDKTGLAAFAAGLIEAGAELIASGGTAAALRAAGLPVRTIEDLTGFPEILGGRVKTLHPAIHAGLLARDTEADRRDLAERGWAPIDLVAVNLYPFAATVARPDATLADAVENIDIGGVALLRAAAKNFARVTVLCDPADYDRALAAIRQDRLSLELRRELAAKAFAHTAAYDAAIRDYLAPRPTTDEPPARLQLDLVRIQALRYGENPHQVAALYAADPAAGPLGGRQLQGKELSYNNLLDLDAAWRAAASFDEPTVVIVKHLTPCGIASAASLAEAFPAALASDPVSAFGGVIAANRPFDGATAEALGSLFVEAIAAPAFNVEALAQLARRANCRLLEMGRPAPTGLKPGPGSQVLSWEMRSVRGGLLVQSPDPGDQAEWQVVTRRAPDERELIALRFAWRACQHVKSNAIVLAQGTVTVGIGGGLSSRVDAVKLAVTKAGERAQGAALASDAFFPFPDGVEEAGRAGVTAVVQPGGSVRDAEVIAAADRLGLAMCFTGVRHFRH